MKLKVDSILKDITGEEIKDGGAPLNLKTVYASALLQPTEKNKKISLKDSIGKNMLAEKIYKAESDAEMSLDEMKLIKDALEDASFPIRIKALAALNIEEASK